MKNLNRRVVGDISLFALVFAFIAILLYGLYLCYANWSQFPHDLHVAAPMNSLVQQEVVPGATQQPVNASPSPTQPKKPSRRPSAPTRTPSAEPTTPAPTASTTTATQSPSTTSSNGGGAGGTTNP